MSKDLSSKSTKFAGIYRVIPAVFIVLATSLLFILGQFMGLIIFTLVLSFAGLNPEEITSALKENPSAKLLATLLIEAVTVGIIFLFLKYLGEKSLKFLKLDKKLNFKHRL